MTKTVSTTPYAGPRGADALHSRLSTAVIAFHEAVARRLGMTAADRKVLGVLCDLGPVTPGQLAQATGLTTGAITGVVDRLEAAGYAAREPNPADRRSLVVRPLKREEHLAEVGAAFASLSRAMAALQSTYSAQEIAVIHRYLAETTEVLKAEAGKLTAGD